MWMFIKWLVSRKVFCVEDFPIRLDAIEDLVKVLDVESYCPLLRSIKIERWSINQRSSDISHLESNLSVFLSHCHNLQGVTINVDKIDRYYEYLTDVVLGVLVDKLRENSLVKISIQTIDTNRNHEFNVMMITYLSSSGGFLEVLEVFSKQKPFNAEDLVAAVAASCPKLTRLVTVHGEQSSMETLRRLYEQCPHLQDVSIGLFNKVIETDEKKKSVSIRVKDSSTDWAICLSHALRRRQYKQVTLRLTVDHYHPVRTLQFILEPYEIHLSLHLFPAVNNQHTNATLAAISEHANSLTELKFHSIEFSDTLLSELIKTCQLLKRLTIDACGWESLVAISKLSNLNMVELSMAESVSIELLDGLLLSEKSNVVVSFPGLSVAILAVKNISAQARHFDPHYQPLAMVVEKVGL
eukprot:scaffold1830_cov227-Ochromonas_danica.AAC.5